MNLIVSTSRGPFIFDGPHTDINTIKNSSGVYVITTLTANGDYKIIDAGESNALRERIKTHDRRDSWGRYRQVRLQAFVYYCAETDRMMLEKLIRDFNNPPCGER